MTVRELLESVDSARPNDICDDIKIRLINDVEGRILCEICKKQPSEVTSLLGEDDILSVPEPYSRVYMLYLVSMLELMAGNYSAYSSVSAEFDKAFVEYGKWYLRNKG